MSALFQENYGGHFQILDDVLLGILRMNESTVLEVVTKVAREQIQ